MTSAQAFLLARLPWIVDCSIWPVSTPSHVFLDHFAILCFFLNVYHLSLVFFENAWHNDTWHFVVLWGAAWLPHRHLKSFIRFHEADLKAANLFIQLFFICFLGRSLLFCMHSSLLACWLILFVFFEYHNLTSHCSKESSLCNSMLPMHSAANLILLHLNLYTFLYLEFLPCLRPGHRIGARWGGDTPAERSGNRQARLLTCEFNPQIGWHCVLSGPWSSLMR